MKGYPSAIVFDLDYTLWPWWCDCHISPPIKKKTECRLIDSSGEVLELYEDVQSIFQELEEKNVILIGASRTATPEIAISILSSFVINGKRMIDYFHTLQWGQHSKVRHIKKAAKELGLEQDLLDGNLLLFDDESRNKDVTSIKCNFVLVPDNKAGLTRDVFENGINKWRLTKAEFSTC
ncbi:CIC11C00000003820 [Sungouiella intermedia]|uniref:CIC11C00000003820 n=1 Tax=Sungouiella intermedia TaxID=45354 RepID=A0A1L0DP67_9ASCO|nr:CIC11C00000003820 [[Candida] intermedia]